GKYVLFLNNDTEPHPEWLKPMIDVVDTRPEVAMVGCKLLYPNGTIQHAGVMFAYASPDPISPFNADSGAPSGTSTQVRELKAVTAACMLIRSNVFKAMGGFDEGYLNGYEDIDLCLR